MKIDMGNWTTCPICKRKYLDHEGGLTYWTNIGWACRVCAKKILFGEINEQETEKETADELSTGNSEDTQKE